MSTFKIKMNWKRDSDFSYEIFNRDHQINFSGNQSLNTSAAREYFGSDEAANPEELLAASLSSCHMLTFLAVASKSGYTVDEYKTVALALLNKNDEGRMAVTEINLYPEIVFSGNKLPTDEQLKSLHDKAHRNCFIAQSLKTKVNIF